MSYNFCIMSDVHAYLVGILLASKASLRILLNKIKKKLQRIAMTWYKTLLTHRANSIAFIPNQNIKHKDYRDKLLQKFTMSVFPW